MKVGSKSYAFIKRNKKINFNELDEFCKNQIYLILKDQNLCFYKRDPKSPTGKF